METLKKSIELLEQVTDAFYILDTNHCFAFMNAGAQRLVGSRSEDLTGKDHWTIYPDDVLYLYKQHFLKAMSGDSPEFDMFFGRRWLRVRVCYLEEEELAVCFHDISRLKQFEGGHQPLWERTPGRSLADNEAIFREDKYQSILSGIDEGFCIVEVLFDEESKPVDYRFLEINRSFEGQTGIKDARGKRMRELAPNHEQHWFDNYGQVALTGLPIRFESLAKELGRWYDVYAFRFGKPENHQVAILFNDISCRKKAERALKEALEGTNKKNRELSSVNEYLDDFVQMAAHDLRSPVSTMKLLFNVMDRTSDREVRSGYINVLRETVDRLDDMLGDLVELISVKDNPAHVAKKISFQVLFEDIINSRQKDLDEINARIDTTVNCPEIIYVKAFLQSIIMNLFNNAIKYRAADRSLQISITTSKKDGFVVLAFRDNGIGLDLEKHGDDIFKPFKRFTTKAKGKGMGLHLVKSMVEKNGGKIAVESAPDKGMTLTVYLKAYPCT